MLGSTQLDRQWSCEHCFSSFFRWEHLLAHKASCHPQGGENQCIQCYLYFQDRDQLDTHITIAHDGRPEPTPLAGRNRIACEQCSKAKAGCDRKVPCMRCLSKGLECRPKHAVRKMRLPPFDRKALQRRPLSANWSSTTLPDIPEASSCHVDVFEDQRSTSSAPCSAMDWTLDEADPGGTDVNAFRHGECQSLTDTSVKQPFPMTGRFATNVLESTAMASVSEASLWIVPGTRMKHKARSLGADEMMALPENTSRMGPYQPDESFNEGTAIDTWSPGFFPITAPGPNHGVLQPDTAVRDDRPTSDQPAAPKQKISKTQKIWNDFLTLRESDLGQLYQPPQLRELLEKLEDYAKRAIKLYRNKDLPIALRKALKLLRRWDTLCGQQLVGTGTGSEDLLKFTILSLNVVLECIISVERESPRLHAAKSLRIEAWDCGSIGLYYLRIKEYHDDMPPEKEKWEEDLRRVRCILDLLGLLSID